MTLHTWYEVSGPKFHLNPLSGFEEEGVGGGEGLGGRGGCTTTYIRLKS